MIQVVFSLDFQGARFAYQDGLNPVLESEQQQENSHSAACCSSWKAQFPSIL